MTQAKINLKSNPKESLKQPNLNRKTIEKTHAQTNHTEALKSTRNNPQIHLKPTWNRFQNLLKTICGKYHDMLQIIPCIVQMKMLPVRCKQEIQGQNALNPMQIAYFSSEIVQILWKEEMSANNAQSTDS